MIPTSVAVSSIGDPFADAVDDHVRSTPHQMGTSQSRRARKQTKRVLAGVRRNPNIGATLVIELGTESIDTESLADDIAESGVLAETLSVREVGGTRGSIDEGYERATQLRKASADTRREEADASELVFGVECGGSDATSGIAANPAVGNACD